ncbi:MAG: hypothetical protein RLZZ385_1398 [Pseudomonadota bacterium]|jgi:glutamate carboxypeptidase
MSSHLRNFLHAVCPALLLVSLAHAADNSEPPLTTEEQAMVAWVSTQEDAMIGLLEQLTNINSGSLNKAGVAAVGEILSRELASLGFSISTLPGGLVSMPHCPGSDPGLDVADHVLATRSGSGPGLLLMGHMDTVFPPGSAFQRFEREGELLRGPGVFDMKGGLVVMLYALKALQAQGLLDDRAITVLLNSDEEVGSLSSRPYLEEEARRHDYGLVFEGSVNNNQIRQRKGLGQVRLVVNGRASHAGSAHQDGRSAVRELAYKIIEMENMTDYEAGLTVNVGLISGGEARNMVPPCAEASVDLRYPQPSQGLAAEARFREIAANHYAFPGSSAEIHSEIWVNLHRPPKIPTPESDYLLQRTVALGRLLGEQIGISDSGGGTDGSLTQAVGLPTLDSLGLIGEGGHSEREVVHVDSFVQTTRRAAVLVHRLLQ